MDENFDLNFPEENREPEQQEPPVDQEAPFPEVQELFEQEPVEDHQEEEPATAYRGVGSGRRESPYANSPYVMHHETRTEEPYRPSYRGPELDSEPVRKKKRVRRKNSGTLKRILAGAAVLALVIASCGVTAHLVNSRWEARTENMESAFNQQLAAMQQQIAALSPENTGVSVSGTVAVSDGYTAGQVYAQNVHSVVLIESTVTTSMYGQTATGVSSGSGFIVSEDGYVITNYHVIEGASAVSVVLYNNTEHPAAVVGYDSTNDIALLKLEANGLDAVTLGSSDDLIVGDQVVAIGNPLGELTSTLTVGYVSAKERTVSTDGTIINMIQTDAAINSGNSGGPLFNMKGEVVGITTAKYSGASSSGATIEGIGFAIPIDDVLEEIGELKEFGYIKSAYLGVMVQNMDASTANVYGLPVGAYVASVEEGYCAQRAGIQAKDIIIAVGDVKTETISDLTRALRDYEPGEKARITVYRGGQTLTFLVVLDERPADADSKTTETQPQQQMPEGNFEDWFDYFAPFFGYGNGD